MIEKQRKGRRVLNRTITFRCKKCNKVFDLSDDIFNRDQNSELYSARSSSSTSICTNCNSLDFNVFPKYQWVYRKRCPKCSEMFETPNSWDNKCKPCSQKWITTIAKMGM